MLAGAILAITVVVPSVEAAGVQNKAIDTAIQRQSRLPKQVAAGTVDSPMKVALFQATPVTVTSIKRFDSSLVLVGAPGPDTPPDDNSDWKIVPLDDDLQPNHNGILPPVEETTVQPLQDEKAALQKSIESDNVATGTEHGSAKRTLDDGTSVWIASKGITLRQVLQAWTADAKWSLFWSSDQEYVLQAAAEFPGDFLTATGTLLSTFEKAEPPVFGEFFTKNRVLVVTTPIDYGN